MLLVRNPIKIALRPTDEAHVLRDFAYHADTRAG